MSVYKIFPPFIRPDIPKTVFFANFQQCSILVFVRLSVTLICFPFNFLLFLKIFALTLYLENLMIIGRGLLLSGFRLPKQCDLSISSSSISFFKTLITTSSMFSWFSSSIPCISKRFLLEYCS